MRGLITILILLVILTGCEEEFDRPKEIEGGQLVVYARVSTLEGDSYVQLGETVNKTRRPFTVSNAVVNVIDDENQEYPFVELSEGIYRPLNEGFIGLPGTVYELSIVLENGREYGSSQLELLPAFEMDSVYSEFIDRKQVSESGIASELTFLDFRVNSNLGSIEKEKFIRWDLEETFLITQIIPPSPTPRYVVCFITQNTNTQQINLLRTSALNSGELTNFSLGSRVVDYTFGEKHAIQFFQRNINRESFEYWSDIESVASVSGSIFDDPPATVIGNIYNVDDPNEIVLGTFETSGTTRKRIYYYPVFFPFEIETVCEWKYWKRYYPGFCRNCLSHPNSSLELVDWFLRDEE